MPGARRVNRCEARPMRERQMKSIPPPQGVHRGPSSDPGRISARDARFGFEAVSGYPVFAALPCGVCPETPGAKPDAKASCRSPPCHRRWSIRHGRRAGPRSPATSMPQTIRGQRARPAIDDACHGVLCVAIEAGGRVHVPLAAVSFLEPRMHGIAQGNLEGLQGSMKCSPQLSVSHVEPHGARMIAPSRFQISLHPCVRESSFECVKGVDIRHCTINFHVRNPPGPPLLCACARGLSLYVSRATLMRRPISTLIRT